MMYLIKLEDGTVLWVNDHEARDLQSANRILYVIEETKAPHYYSGLNPDI